MIRLAVTVLLLGLTASCAGTGQRLRAERVAKLNEIADLCGLPRAVFKLRGTDELRLQPSPETPYEAVDCALRELRKTDLPMKLGFVGNEAPAEPEEQ